MVLRNTELDTKYRMPTVFGPLPGPRNVPENQRHRIGEMDVTALRLSARATPAALTALLPPGAQLHGEPILNVEWICLSNIGWFGGRGYNILKLGFEIAVVAGHQTLTGEFTPVMWESKAEPIITGREELGFSKLFAEIPDLSLTEGGFAGSVSWEGYRWFEAEVSGLEQVELPPAVPPAGNFHYRYFPRVGAQGDAEAAGLYFIPAASPHGASGLIRRCQGAGRFAFRPARWEDVPYQYPIMNALAAIPLTDFGPAVLTVSQTRQGGPAGHGMQRVEIPA